MSNRPFRLDQLEPSPLNASVDYFNVDKASYVALFYTSALAKDKTKNKKTLKLNDTTPFHAKMVPFHSNQNMLAVAKKRRRKKSIIATRRWRRWRRRRCSSSWSRTRQWSSFRVALLVTTWLFSGDFAVLDLLSYSLFYLIRDVFVGSWKWVSLDNVALFFFWLLRVSVLRIWVKCYVFLVIIEMGLFWFLVLRFMKWVSLDSVDFGFC